MGILLWYQFVFKIIMIVSQVILENREKYMNFFLSRLTEHMGFPWQLRQ